MKRSTFFILLFLFSLLAVVGVKVLLQQDAAKELVLEDSSPGDRAESVQSQTEGPNGSLRTRELIAPITDLPRVDEEMPPSYKASLGGIKGRLVEEDGTPVPGLKVELYGIGLLDVLMDAASLAEDPGREMAFRVEGTTTALDGTFRLGGVYPRALYLLGADLRGPRATTRFVDCMPGPGEIKDLGDIVLKPFAVLLGRLEDEEGRPISGARVRATDLPPVVFLSGVQNYRKGCSLLVRFDKNHRVMEIPRIAEQFLDLVPIPETSSGEDGAFRLEGVPLGLLNLIVDRPGLVTAQQGPISTTRGGEKDLGTIVMDRGVTLKGKVVDHKGEPVFGAEVRVGGMYSVTEMILLQPSIATDEKGVFVSPGTAPRATFAAARRLDTDPWTVTGPFDPESEQPVLTLPPAYDLRLIITRDDGTPVDKVRIRIQEELPFGGFLPLQPPKTLDSRIAVVGDGVFEVAGLAKGTYALLISASGCGMVKESLTIGGEAVEKEIVLEPAHEASIRVLAKKTKQPVEWAEVHAVRGDDEAWFNPTRLSRGRTDAQGLAPLRNLAPGDYLVTVSHPGYAVTATQLEVPAKEETVVFLEAGGTLEGMVHSGGVAQEGPFMISLNANQGTLSPEAMTPRFTATDLEGRFRVTNLEPGTWEVHVLKRLLDQDPLGLTEVLRLGPLISEETEIWADETSYIDINLGAEDLGPTGTVSGRIYVDGAPAQGARIGLRARKRFEAEVDAQGRYDLGQIPVGKHSLRIFSLPGATGRFDSSIRRSIEVLENTPLFEDFTLYTGTLTGKVVYEDSGAPVRGVGVSIRISDDDAPYSVRMNTVTGLSGAFVFEGVPVGTYTVQAEDRKFCCLPVTGVKVFPGGRSTPVILTMLTPTQVKGRVVIPEAEKDARWMGLLFKSRDQDQGVREWVRLDTGTGAFETSALVPGLYEAELFGALSGKYKPMEIEVPQGGLSNLLLYPEPGE